MNASRKTRSAVITASARIVSIGIPRAKSDEKESQFQLVVVYNSRTES